MKKGGRYFFLEEKKGARTFFCHIKRGQIFFSGKKPQADISFHRKKGGHEIFSGYRIMILFTRILFLVEIED